MDQQTRERIQGTIDQNDVVLFMKGTPQAPRCGFSATVIQILDSMGAKYASVDVLSDQGVREGIKEFSDWPTIPQLYVKKEFVGGCDIVKEMYGSGELASILGVKVKEIAQPKITVTAAALAALKGAVESADDGVRLEIDGRFNYALSIGQKNAQDILVDSGGIQLILDRGSAQRANGTNIDYVETPEGAAFKIDNPNEPAKVRQLAPKTVAERLKSKELVEFYDVRPESERKVASIPGTKSLDRAAQGEIMKLPKDTMLVFHCHHGSRSQQAADFFLSQGFTNVNNLAGGIDAWSVEVDDSVPRY